MGYMWVVRLEMASVRLSGTQEIEEKERQILVLSVFDIFLFFEFS